MIPNRQSLGLKQPVKVEFIGIMPTLFAHCQHCMDVMHGMGMEPYAEQFEEYPEEIRKQYFAVSDIAQKLRKEFNGIVLFDAIDTASALGVWKTIKHRILRTPCVLVNGKKVFNRVPEYVELRRKVLDALGAGY